MDALYLFGAVVCEGLEHAQRLEEDGPDVHGAELVVPGGQGQLQRLPQLQRERLVHRDQLVHVEEHRLKLVLVQQPSD